MDPNNRGPEEHGQDGDHQAPRPRPPRDPLTTDFGQHAPALARTVQLVSGDFLLTVNPVDGSEIEVCPPAERPARPEKLTAAERAEAERAGRPPVPPGPVRTVLGLLAREDERERLVRLLARGRSVRLTGPAGSGRTSLLDVVAEDCAGLAPDGVVRLSGFRRTADDLLYDLFHAVHRAPLHRPDREELLGHLREVGAVVVLDDVEFGGTALDELLDATPECAFLIGATPDVPAPSADSAVEEVFLTGLDRSDGVELLERAAGRTLTEEEANWAGDLWFESEGLPLRFVQAGALLRRRDRQRAGADAVDEFGVFVDARPADDTPYDAAEAAEVPLPSLGEAAAPAPLLASRLSASARATLEFAVALGGEVPHQAHLPALVGDTHADAALGELTDCGLVSPVGSRYRLAAGVLTQLESAGYADDVRERALAATQHYAWWAGHPSVTPERVCAEADAVLAALSVLVPATTPPADDEESPAVQLARTAAPAFAAGLHWSAWQRALRSGTEASRLAGDVAEQAYFHHELGVLALCEGHLDRARAELEASIGLRGALSDKRGAVAGRRALALVADRSGDTPGLGTGAGAFGGAGAAAGFGVVGLGPTAGEEVPDARNEESASPPAGVPAPFPPLQPPPQAPTLVTSREASTGPSRKAGVGIKGFARRNLVAAGAGALLVAVLGTVVTLGATSENDAGDPSDQVGVNPSASQGVDDGSLGADRPSDDGANPGDTGRPTDPGPDGTVGTSDDPTPSESASPSDGPSSPGGSDEPGDSESPDDPGSPDESSKPPTSPSTKPTTPKPTDTEPTDPGTPTETEEPTTPAPTDTETPPPSTPETSDTASGPGAPSTTAGSPAGTATASQSSTATSGTGTGTGTPSGSGPATGQII
ncbi:ATP-binding protein [Streptomyces sp. BB1-1-1]|uniref:ATP-binding protein n=1 Tax=Streptomyces sp. BB1-1-1 TaxID=3074430 RepID=UPI002877E73C|nr:ATP-binding protein [Streptomyces sp. BB1-1-1]WND35102.1 ATP-binding protein [Streptomyces sp. BB1-1-1]